MPPCSAWDVVRVPFPSTFRPIQQRRPALVVAVPEAAGTPTLLWLLMITSAANRAWPGDVPIARPAATGLPSPSIVRTAKIAMIDHADAEPIGTLPPPDRLAVAHGLRELLGPAIALA